MLQIKNILRSATGILLVCSLLVGCTSEVPVPKDQASIEESTSTVSAKEPIQYQVDSKTFSLDILSGEDPIRISLPGKERRVENYVTKDGNTTWEYPEEKIAISITPEDGYLEVNVKSLTEADNTFSWPIVSGEQYYLPLGEGKRIMQEDVPWSTYLSGKEFSAMEQLSMPFWASVQGEYAALVVLENPYRSNLVFAKQEAISFQLEHQYPKIDKEKENCFRIYITQNDPVSVAKLYRSYVKEQGRFVTLEEKAMKNPNIEKLYGAPHIYLSGDNLLTPQDINWPAFRSALGGEAMQYVLSTIIEEEAAEVFAKVKTQDYVDDYQKNVICRVLSEAMKQEDFYNAEKLPLQDESMKVWLSQGAKDLSTMDRLQLHKHALAVNLPEVFVPVEHWMNSATVDLVKDMKQAGMNRAWIGLNSWEQAYAKPELVSAAQEEGYLIASYDSYHSIHKPGKEQWITAKFEDQSLYEEATVLKQNGGKEVGFQKVGRKLNPTLSMEAVKQRLSEIMETGLAFNSWFIDCDATGEIYDDYTPKHQTTMQQDLSARLERMAYIRDEYSQVIGSEGGNDFAASTIAFAHGIELPTFSWQDADMKSNKESPYYIGGYYSPTGGVAAHFAKQIPIKEKFYTIFLDPKYDLPLFKLVYNDSVITGYHWDWSTFKIKGAVANRMLREVLYNTPPLYQLDQEEWKKYKQDIVSHNKVWSVFAKEAVQKEMTGFSYLDEDGNVQRTEYGEGLSVVANFSDASFAYEKQNIAPHSLLLKMGGEMINYTPIVQTEERNT